MRNIVKATITNIQRRQSSASGNPRYRLSFHYEDGSGYSLLTAPDIADAHVVTDGMRGETVILTINSRRQIIGIQR